MHTTHHDSLTDSYQCNFYLPIFNFWAVYVLADHSSKGPSLIQHEIWFWDKDLFELLKKNFMKWKRCCFLASVDSFCCYLIPLNLIMISSWKYLCQHGDLWDIYLCFPVTERSREFWNPGLCLSQGLESHQYLEALNAFIAGWDFREGEPKNNERETPIQREDPTFIESSFCSEPCHVALHITTSSPKPQRD